jgi:hypothetical protein
VQEKVSQFGQCHSEASFYKTLLPHLPFYYRSFSAAAHSAKKIWRLQIRRSHIKVQGIPKCETCSSVLFWSQFFSLTADHSTRKNFENRLGSGVTQNKSCTQCIQICVSQSRQLPDCLSLLSHPAATRYVIILLCLFLCFFVSLFLCFFVSFILSFVLSFFLSFVLSFFLSFFLTFYF